MTRYFFDFAGGGQLLYDHQGREFPNPEAACQFAELIALDLGVEDKWMGWVVAVHNAVGKKMISIPVQEADRIAA